VSPPESITIVGASIAGLRTAVAVRRRGFTGPLTLIGAEAHWPPIDRPPLSKQVLRGEASSEQVRLPLPSDLDITVMTGRRVVGFDLAGESITLDDGTSAGVDRLVIATGAEPRMLPGVPAAAVHVLRTADDADRLRGALGRARSVAIIGAGFIGCEVASSCRHLGKDVVMIDVADQPLAPLGPAMGAAMAQVIRAQGIDLRLGTRIAEIGSSGAGASICLDDGERVEVDAVIVGVGVTPATGWLEGSGLQLDDGVVCDQACLALGGEGRVAAVGDVARWEHVAYGSIRVEHWTNAGEQAAHVARALLDGGEAAGPYRPVPYFWSDQFDQKLQFIGRCGPDDHVEVVDGSIEEASYVARYSHGDTTTAALCVNRPRDVPRWTQIVTAALTAEVH
jgi:NADPH-dependent 2,4-dienoyl-CoA reductase/sulfur reductase-like enzyme